MEIQKIEATLEGLSPIMFDRFFDHSKEVRPPEQKLYLFEKNLVVLPTENLFSFLFADGNPGCAKTFEGKKSKNYIRTGDSHVSIDPVVIPFMNGKNKVEFKGFDKRPFWIHEGSPVTRSAGGARIKQELKFRPVLSLPWQLCFVITLIKNPIIDENKLYNWFMQGGILIGLGTYRPRFGRFTVGKWKTR